MILDGTDFKAPPVKYPQFSKRLKAARKARRMTLFDMAEAIGMDLVAYSKIDNGRDFPDDKTLAKINRILFGE